MSGPQIYLQPYYPDGALGMNIDDGRSGDHVSAQRSPRGLFRVTFVHGPIEVNRYGFRACTLRTEVPVRD